MATSRTKESSCSGPGVMAKGEDTGLRVRRTTSGATGGRLVIQHQRLDMLFENRHRMSCGCKPTHGRNP